MSTRFGPVPTVEDTKSILTPEAPPAAASAPPAAKAPREAKPKAPKVEYQQRVEPLKPGEVVGRKKRKLKEFAPVDIPQAVLDAWEDADADDPRDKRHINVKIDKNLYNEIEYCAMLLRMSLTDYIVYAHKMIAPKRKD